MHGCHPKRARCPPPPRCPPPDPIAGLGACWNGSQELYDLVKTVLLDVLATDPQELPQPPGVTTGVPAAAGQVGEIFTASTSGTWQQGGSTSVSPGINFVVPNAPLPAGDWDVTWQVSLPAVGANGVGGALCRLGSPVPPQATNNMAAYAVNIPNNMAPAGDPTTIQPLVINGPSVPFVSALPLGLVFNLFVWPSGIMTSGPYTFNIWARRRR